MTGAGGEGGPRGIFLLILKDKPKHIFETPKGVHESGTDFKML